MHTDTQDSTLMQALRYLSKKPTPSGVFDGRDRPAPGPQPPKDDAPRQDVGPKAKAGV